MKLTKLDFMRLDARSGWYKKLGVGNKAALLNHAVKSGLPVPNGVTLLDGAWQRLIDDGLMSVDNGDVTVEAADELLERFALRRPKKALAVRSAFSAEDRADSSMAGYFRTYLNISPNDKSGLINALIDVWQSPMPHGLMKDDVRRDMLVMEMVDAKVAGVAFTEAAFEDDLVNFTEGTADKLVGGEVEGQTVRIPKIKSLEPATLPPGWQRRLQLLLRGVRLTFNLQGTDWDIEWADDGQRCWLLQVRPITASPRRNEAFTYANLREILPDPPSPFMTSIVLDASSAFFDWYRRFDKTLPTNRMMVEVFYGRPLFNLSLLTDMMRTWGLPSALVTNSIGGSADVESDFNVIRFLRKSWVLLRLGWSQLTAVSSANRKSDRLLADTQAIGRSNNLSDYANQFRDMFALFVTEMFNLTQAMSGPLLLLRQSGALDKALTDSTITTQLFQQFSELRRISAENPHIQPTLAAGKLPDHAEFNTAWQTFLRDFGHRAVFESDIARPRYDEQQTELLKTFANSTKVQGTPRTAPRTTRNPLWWQLNRVQQARELWRHNAMHSYRWLRQRMLALAAEAVERGQLPAVEDVWWLDKSEWAQLDKGKVFSAEFFARRRAEFETLKQIEVPDLMYRFDDLISAEVDTADLQAAPALKGISLNSGSATGQAWVLREPGTELPDGYDPATTILVARSVDAGWIATFGLVAGVVVEIGGDLSHGSILLREVGIPAITNVRGATAAFADGETLEIESGKGIVRRVRTSAQAEPAHALPT